MKKFSFHSIANQLALRPSLIELRAHRIALPGIASQEPLQRGCNQRDWLERMAALGIRHLVVPLNGTDEDSCLYARRHPSSTSAEVGMTPTVYDLAHRDEGFFARLQFLMQAADQIGILLGLSLFHAASTRNAGPFYRKANEQGVSFDDVSMPPLAIDEKKSGGKRRRHVSSLQKLEASLHSAVDWLAAELRGRQGVWVEVFRGQPDVLNYQPPPTSIEPLAQLEQSLCKRMAAALIRPGEDEEKTRLGPWLATPPGTHWIDLNQPHVAPFTVQHGLPFAQKSFSPASLTFNAENAGRRANVCWIAGESRTANRATLWRTLMRGSWPIVGVDHSESNGHIWKDMAQVATFGRQWAGSGYIRPCPEMLIHISDQDIASGKVSASTDGKGRYFVYLTANMKTGLDLETLPGAYRYFWFDTVSGRGLDFGDGICGGTHCSVPVPASVRQALLILEQEELPDPFSIW